MKLRPFLLPLCLIGLLSACEKEAAPIRSEITVKIGHAGPLSGNIAHLGLDNENGVRLAIEDINNAGGIQIAGQTVKFTLVSEDDQADPAVAVNVAQRLVEQQVVGVIGHLNSGATIAAAPIYAQAGIVQISPSSTAVAYTRQGLHNVFRVIANDARQGSVLGAFAVNKLAARHIAILDDRSVYGQGLADEFEHTAKAAGARIVKREYTTPQETDFTHLIANIKNSKPDLLFYGGMDAQAALLRKQAHKLNIPLIGGDGIQSMEFIKQAGAAAEGSFASSPGQPKSQLPGGRIFLEHYKQRYGREVQLYAPYCYDAVMVLVEAMKAANSIRSRDFLPLLARSRHDGVTGPIAFDAKGDLQNGATTLYQARAGQWVPVETF